MAASSADPDLNLAASYPTLFTETRSTDVDSSSRVVESESVGWEEDEWTSEDTAEAERILREGLERCRLDESQLPIKGIPSETDESSTWNQFYSRHGTNFFKDRHYFATAFPNEFGSPTKRGRRRRLVEVGCGVGNALLPLLDSQNEGGEWCVFGMDVSSVAIELLKEDRRFKEASENGRAHARCCDLTASVPRNFVGVGDVTTLLFCLSAIGPDDHIAAAKNAASTLASNGVLLVRDYGLYDEAQLKLASQRNKLLKPNFYRKHDGTKCYYFSTDDLERLFCKHAGLKKIELRYLRRIYKNRSTDTTRRRVWVQGRFQKC